MLRNAPNRRRLIESESRSTTPLDIPPSNTRDHMRAYLNNMTHDHSAPETDALTALQRLESLDDHGLRLDDNWLPVHTDSANRRRATLSSRFVRRQQQRPTLSRNIMEENTYATLDELEAAGERLRSVNEEVRELLARPLVAGALTRREAVGVIGRSEDGQASRKRRRVERSASPKSTYPEPYGYFGQAVPTALRMIVVSSDGGTMPPYMSAPLPSQSGSLHLGPWEYSARNVLRNDRSVYCTSMSKCNMVLCHDGETLFNLSKLVIRAPKTGYTHPLQRGLIFVGLQKDELFNRTRDYKIANLQDSEFATFVNGRERRRRKARPSSSNGVPLATALTPQRSGDRENVAEELRQECDHAEGLPVQDEPNDSEDDSGEEQEDAPTVNPTLLRPPQVTDSDSDSSDDEVSRRRRPPRGLTPLTPGFEHQHVSAYDDTIEVQAEAEAREDQIMNGALDEVGNDHEDDDSVDLSELLRRGAQAQIRRNVNPRPSVAWQMPAYPELLPMPHQAPPRLSHDDLSHATATTSTDIPTNTPTESLLKPLAHFQLRAIPNPATRPRPANANNRPQPVHVGDFVQHGRRYDFDDPYFIAGFISDSSEPPLPPPPPAPTDRLRVITPASPPNQHKHKAVSLPRKISHGDGISTTKVTTRLSKDGCSVTITFSPPVSARYLLLKMWREDADGEGPVTLEQIQEASTGTPQTGPEMHRSAREVQRLWARLGEPRDEGNIDIERVEAWGTQGRVWCPSGTVL